MRSIAGAVLLLAAEQAFAHAHMAGFPHAAYVQEVLLPCSMGLAALGVGFLVWGLFRERQS